jgi:prepilin-type processing-associated H-X9-DG protein
MQLSRQFLRLRHSEPGDVAGFGSHLQHELDLRHWQCPHASLDPGRHQQHGLFCGKVRQLLHRFAGDRGRQSLGRAIQVGWGFQPLFATPGWGGSYYVAGNAPPLVYLWQQQPNPWQTACNQWLPSSAHMGGMNVGLGDGSVRFVTRGLSQTTWTLAVNPADGLVMGPDW